MKSYQNQLFLVTVIFFVLGFLHISLALLGLLCMILPFIQYWKYKDKVWCKSYCPRAGFFNKVIKKVSLGKSVPKWMTGKGLRKAVVTYFVINLFFATMSTIMVSIGRIDPIEQVRFLIIFPLPGPLLQLLNWSLPSNLTHISYRIYSMMFTSTIIGSLLGLI